MTNDVLFTFFTIVFILFPFLRLIINTFIGFLYRQSSLDYKFDVEPMVSVIIPAWNEEVGIKKTIESVIEGRYKNFEVIVIDDGSVDDTSYLVSSVIKERPDKNIKLIRQENKGKAHALNIGVANSNAKYILTLDADSVLAEDALFHLMKRMISKNCDAVIGRVLIGGRLSIINLAQYFEYLITFHIKKTQSMLNSILIMSGAISLIRKELIIELGFFDGYAKTEDFDLTLKLKSIGSKIEYEDRAFCITEGASSFRTLVSQRTRWRYGFIKGLLRRRSYVIGFKKGIYLTLFELPFALWSLLELIIYPLTLVLVAYFTLFNMSLTEIFIFYLVLPYIFLLVLLSNKSTIKINKYLPYVIFVPVFSLLTNVAELMALLKTIVKLLLGSSISWTEWKRSGV